MAEVMKLLLCLFQSHSFAGSGSEQARTISFQQQKRDFSIKNKVRSLGTEQPERGS